MYLESICSRLINPFPNKPWFLRVCSTSPLKTLWEQEKLLVTSNFFFYQCFLPFMENFQPFSNLKLSSAKSFNLDQSKIFLSGNGLNRIDQSVESPGVAFIQGTDVRN